MRELVSKSPSRTPENARASTTTTVHGHNISLVEDVDYALGEALPTIYADRLRGKILQVRVSLKAQLICESRVVPAANIRLSPAVRFSTVTRSRSICDSMKELGNFAGLGYLYQLWRGT